MLTHLSIQNFALIDKIDLDLQQGLTVITGETGAGKSILLGALGLILGKRADHTTLKDDSKKCIIEGTFLIKGYDLNELFIKHDIDYADETILRREISSSGKSRSFINDTVCTLEVMKQLGNYLIDIHSQQQSLQLNDADFQLEVLDSLAQNSSTLATYKEHFIKYTTLKKKYKKVEEQQINLKKEEDFLNFQFNELDALKLEAGENEKLELEQVRFANSEDVLSNLEQIRHLLDAEENNCIDQLKRLKQLCQNLEKYDSSTSEIVSRVNSLYIELQDIAEEIGQKSNDFEYHPERHQFVEERLGEIHRLQKKHQVAEANDLILLKEEIENQLMSISNSDHDLAEIKKAIDFEKTALEKLATTLTNNRLAVITTLQASVKVTLRELGIPHAQLLVEHHLKEAFGINGRDAFQYLFSANKGVAPAVISKTASGGESSRLMLAIKEILAENHKLPTILFDEIDTGVSGEIADKMGTILSKMGQKRQVISITHLAQIAGKGQHHLYVYKDDTNERSITQIKNLTPDERVKELAKMLSGAVLSAAALNNARELLQQ